MSGTFDLYEQLPRWHGLSGFITYSLPQGGEALTPAHEDAFTRALAALMVDYRVDAVQLHWRRTHWEEPT